ncbi:entericidin A/B family lipoprotein [Acidimangrovimonas sediminis]|nr:entericidin A/B family lipoprotein [Acidimangrovimonas sediminis]
MIRIALVLAVAVGLAGCDTVAGAGKDIQKGGQAVTSSAKQTQAQM